MLHSIRAVQIRGRSTQEQSIATNQISQLLVVQRDMPATMPLLKQLEVFGDFQRGTEGRLGISGLARSVCLMLRSDVTWVIASRHSVSHGVSSRLTSAYAACRALLLSPSFSKEDGLMCSRAGVRCSKAEECTPFATVILPLGFECVWTEKAKATVPSLTCFERSTLQPRIVV